MECIQVYTRIDINCSTQVVSQAAAISRPWKAHRRHIKVLKHIGLINCEIFKRFQPAVETAPLNGEGTEVILH